MTVINFHFWLLLVATLLACKNRTTDLSVLEGTKKADLVLPERVNSTGRVVAIGDIHGDLAAARKVLELAGIINKTGKWIAGKTIVVQVGDQLDRGNDDRGVLDYFEELIIEAQSQGGGFFPMIGNHETMNVQLDFRYVTPKSMLSFSEFASANPHNATVKSLPKESWGRATAFIPGGPYARILARHPAALIVDDTVFVHGGLLPAYAKRGIGSINQSVRNWMNGDTAMIPPVVNDDDGPLWNRTFSASPSGPTCVQLQESLDLLGVKRMVVAHTPQSQGINGYCHNKVWRVDCGLSAYYGGTIQALQIQGHDVNILK